VARGGAEKESKVMTRAKSILATLAVATVLGGAGAVVVSSRDSGNAHQISTVQDTKITLAQAVPEQLAPPPGTTAAGPRTSLAQAVSVAEQQTGGRAINAQISRKRGSHFYVVRTLSKDTSAKVFVDPASGSIVRVDEPGLIARAASVFDRDDQWKEQALLAALEASRMTLAGAITAAEKETGGRAIRAASVDQYGATSFGVSLIREATMLRVHVDSTTGKVVTIPIPPTRTDDDD
jgi:uncharacterized membrane protein YkoI